MAQLSPDTLAFEGPLLSLTQAQRHVYARAPIKSAEILLSLGDLPGRILAEPAVARASAPPFANAAVDGYAYVHGQGPSLALVGCIAAGHPIPPDLSPGTAVRVLTGAPVPSNADTVIMDEDARTDANHVHVTARLNRGSNLRPKGEDVTEGQCLFPTGHQIRPVDLARLAAAGLDSLKVKERLRIALLSTGDELQSGQIADANRWLLQAVFAANCFDVQASGMVGDDLAAIKAKLEGVRADLILTSGGVSGGERDLVRQALDALGDLEFWRVGIKPGRPVAFATRAGTPVFALPGNPVACFITATFLALPFAYAQLGTQWRPRPIPVTLGVNYQKKAGRTEFVRVHLDAAGCATPYAVAGAGVLSSLTQTDGLVILEPTLTQIAAGTKVPYLPFQGVLP